MHLPNGRVEFRSSFPVFLDRYLVEAAGKPLSPSSNEEVRHVHQDGASSGRSTVHTMWQFGGRQSVSRDRRAE
jgi:hypothetical protein